MSMSSKERAALASSVIDQVRGLDDVEELDLETLKTMSTDDLFAYLEAHGITLDRKRLAQQMRQRIGPSLDALNDGVMFDSAKEEKFAADLEKAIRSQARITSKDVMGSMREQVLSEADERPDYERFLCWVAKLKNSCRSCEERHGQILSEAQWDDIGRPRSGSTLCGDECCCDLVPVAVTREASQQRLDEINREGPRRKAVARLLGGT